MNNKNFLQHYGILGMKWGRRKRKASTTVIRTRNSEDHDKKLALKGKKLSEMTNDELRTYTQRMALEKQFKELSKADMTRGQKIVNGLMSSVTKGVNDTIMNYANKQAAKLVDELIKKSTKAVT